MELTESIESLNKQLVDEYGIDTSTNQPMFRIVWSDDQKEMRLTKEVAGIQLIYPTVREMPKYPFIKSLFVLERLVVVPDLNRQELAEVKLSYEPIWSFCTPARVYLPPTWQAAKFVVDTLYAALGKKSLAKYKEGNSIEAREKRIEKLQEEMFGNETEVTDALAHKEGVVVPGVANEPSR